LHAHFSIATTPQFLRGIALASLVIALAALPGSNAKLPESTQHLVVYLVEVAFAGWLVSRVLEWRAPLRHERAVWLIAVGVCICGWVVTYFPKSIVDRTSGAIFELDRTAWTAFGTMDQAASTDAMMSLSLAAMVLLMALDFGSQRSGRIVLALAVTLSGFFAAVAGLCLNTRADLASLWQTNLLTDSVFGLIWYHGNAAAFLNLAWPAGVWLCAVLLERQSRSLLVQMMLALLMVAVMIQVIAVFVNVSKMGHLIFVVQAILLTGGGLLIWRPRLAELPLGGRRTLLLVVIGIALMTAAGGLTGAGPAMARWNTFAVRRFDDPARRHAALMAFQIGLDHRWLGTGPGTFEWVAAHYSDLDPVLQGGRWRHAHNDYAQFFAEWGCVGAVFFSTFLLLPGRRLWTALRRAVSRHGRHEMSFQRRTGLVCLATSIASVLIHAGVDFPLQIDAVRYLFAASLGLVLALASPVACIESIRS